MERRHLVPFNTAALPPLKNPDPPLLNLMPATLLRELTTD